MARSVRPIFLREWLILSALLIGLALWLGSLSGLGRADTLIYDRLLPLRQAVLNFIKPSNGSEDILIIAIDNEALTRLGRWPWSRQTHADLLHRLNLAKPRGIAFDLLFPEPESRLTSAADLSFAQAISEAGPLVLAMSINQAAQQGMPASLLLPTTPLLTAVEAAPNKTLGHIHLAIDNDGMARSVFLQEGTPEQQWPHLAPALLQAGGAVRPNLGAPDHTLTPPGQWQRAHDYLIPFIGSAGSFKQISYSAVLNGEVPTEFIHDKWVLIGVTASGLADHFPTPLSDQAAPMPGVEVHANVLASLLAHNELQRASTPLRLVFTTLPLLIFLFACWKATPRFQLLLFGILMVTCITSCFALLVLGYWLPPLAAMLVLALAYPLWSWRRLESVIHFLDQELLQLDAEPRLLPTTQVAMPDTEKVADPLENRISAVRRATERVRELRRFVSQSLENLPDITLVTNAQGDTLIANAPARNYFAAQGIQDITRLNLQQLLVHLHPVALFTDTTPSLHASRKLSPWPWQHLIDPKQHDALQGGMEVRDQTGGEFLIKSAPCLMDYPLDAAPSRSMLGSQTMAATAWLISLIDLRQLRQAEQLRDESLRFLSHDMRGPQASILALLELQRTSQSHGQATLPEPVLFSRIEAYARQTLHLADNFVQLARAESAQYQLELHNLSDLLTDASDELWALAQARQIRIILHLPDEEVTLKAERALLTRALVNLIANAIKYSPAHSTIECSIHRDAEPGLAVCAIRDQGCGIALDDQARLFQRFSRILSSSAHHPDGAGLGLVFVKTVIEKHGGHIEVTSAPQQGATFTLFLPLA